jgi:hypothetical protein
VAFLFGDSFNHYPFADIAKKWTMAGGTNASDIAPAYAPPHHANGFAYAASSAGTMTRTIPNTESFVAGCWYWISVVGATTIMAFMDGATEHCSVRQDATGHITFTRNGTVLATSANVLSSGWWHIEVKATIGDAADSPSGRYQVRVNGSATGWIADSGVGQDTRNAGNKYVTGIQLRTGGTATNTTHRFTDVYICDTTGSVANDFLGPSRFIVTRPVGVGNSADFAGNYAENFANVNELLADGDTTFNQSSTPGHIDLFEHNNVPAGTVHAVQHVIEARDAAVTRTIRAKTRIGGTNYSGPTTAALTAAYLFHCTPVTLSPATSAQWDDGEVNGAEWGYELVS